MFCAILFTPSTDESQTAAMAPKTLKTLIETLYRKGVGFVYRGRLETDLTPTEDD